jgi:N-acetylmuramic acid 6-phosphate etherase
VTQLPPTEAVNPGSSGLDTMSTRQLVELLATEHRIAVDAVLAASNALALAVDGIAARLESGGRLHYVGAGSSGRIGVLDAYRRRRARVDACRRRRRRRRRSGRCRD